MDRSTMVLCLLDEMKRADDAIQDSMHDQDKVVRIVSYKQGLEYALRLFVDGQV